MAAGSGAYSCGLIDIDSDDFIIINNNNNNNNYGTVEVEGERPSDDRLLVQLHTAAARLPTRSTPWSAGLDLYGSTDLVLPPHRPDVGLQPVRVPLDISMSIPRNCYGRITGRSSVCMRGILVMDGVVDSDYRGRVDVMAVNLTATPITLTAGERVAQLVLERIRLAKPQTIGAEHQLARTERGCGGFGSSGR